MNRGSPHSNDSNVQASPGFNEAPIHESGKYDALGLGLAGTLGLQ